MVEMENKDRLTGEAGDEFRASRPSSEPTSTDERMSRASSSEARASHEFGRPAAFSDTPGPVLRRGRSAGASRVQPLPAPATQGTRGLDTGDVVFDPSVLLQEGLHEWHERAASLHNLKRVCSMRAQASRGLEGTPSFRFLERKQSARPSLDSVEDTEGSTVLHSTGNNGDGDKSQSSEASEDYGGAGRLGRSISGLKTPGKLTSEFRHYEGQLNVAKGKSMDLSRDFYAALADAPQASLIHVVSLYHQALMKHGLAEEADKIANVLSEIQTAVEPDEEKELKGMDLLLKEGLLQYLLSVQPYLPPIPSQIVKFKGLTVSRKLKVERDYETMFTKVKGLLTGALRKPTVKDVTLLKDVTGYLMPGTLTLVVGPFFNPSNPSYDPAGPPWCGKSSLHNVIAGRPSRPGSTLAGTVTYNGKNVRDIRYQRLAAVGNPVDVHHPALTVRETLEFARNCTQAYGIKDFGEELKEVMGEALKQGQDPKLELNLSMFGLKRVADRPVGSPMRPSLTDAEKHRLSTAELISGTYAIFIIDQLNAGVDDLTTLDLVTSLRVVARVRKIAVLGTLLQPSAECFALWDRLIVLDGGQVMYQGPRQDVLPYFENLGYFKPNHLSTNEFLSEVTTPEGVRYLRPGYPRLEREDFVASFLLSPTCRDIRRVVNSTDNVEELWAQGDKPLGLGFTESQENNGSGVASHVSLLVAGILGSGGSLAEASMNHTCSAAPGDEVVAVGGAGGMLKYLKTGNRALDTSLSGCLAKAIDKVVEPVRLQLERPFQEVTSSHLGPQFDRDYILDFMPEVMLLLKRELKLTLRNKLGLLIRFAQIMIASVYTGVVFFRVREVPNQLDMNLLRGVFFISVLNLTLFNLGQLPGLLDDRTIYYKQQGAHFYRPQSFLVAKFLGTVPFTTAEATLWTFVVYFMTDLTVKDGGWHFWVYYIIVTLTAINGASMVRFMAFVTPDRDAANGLIGVVVAIFILFAGFLVPRFSCPHYWIWAYYLDPLQWSITALVINEYNSKSYSLLCREVPNILNIPQCVGRPTDTVGHAFLAKGQFYTSHSWIAVSVGVLVGWIVFFNLGAYYALANIRHIPMRISPLMQEKLRSDEQHPIKKGDEEWGTAEQELSHTAVPITLSWHELSYDIMIPAIGQTRTLLNYVSGWGKTGEMVALLGSAGVGKTTLLNCLAGRKISIGRIGGQILVNGYPKVQKTFAHVEGYVEDLKSHAPYMTVREGIAFSAAMRLGKKSLHQKREEFVEEIMQLMQISHISNILLSSLGNEEISREQAVRLAIATELAGNPSVLFLDEPTKGLDSHASVHIIECLKHIADTGRLVITSLRDLSLRQLTAFSSIQLLKRGGETVYFGPVGHNGDLLRKYFEAIPGTALCPPDRSPSSHAIDVIGDDTGDRKALRDYGFEYRVSELALHNHVQLQTLRRSKGENGAELLEFGYRAPYIVMAYEILVKMQRFYWRNVNYNFSRLMSSFLLALILGSVYFNIRMHTTVNMNVKSQSLFIVCILLAISSAQNVIPQILRFTATMERENASNQYSVVLYNLAWTLGEVPYTAVANMIFCFVFCLMAQIAVGSAAQFFKFYFVLFEFCLAITFLGIVIVVISPLPQIAAVLVPIVIGFWTSTGGSVVPKRKILKVVIWIFWSNPVQYALNAMTSIAFFCDTQKPECVDSGRNLACLNTPSACPRCHCERLDDANNVFVWTQLQFNRSLNHHRVPLDMLTLALYCVLFRVITGIVLSYRKQKHQI